MTVLRVGEGAKRASLFIPKEGAKQQAKNRHSGIGYPDTMSECEIQFMILGGLRKMGIDARAEVFSADKSSRFDIVIFRKRAPIGIIEVKKHVGALKKKPRSFREAMGQTTIRKQMRRYSSFGLPLKAAFGRKSILETLRWSRALHEQMGEFRPYPVKVEAA